LQKILKTSVLNAQKKQKKIFLSPKIPKSNNFIINLI
jgi:hypothetical protein